MNQTAQSWASAPPLSGSMRPVRTAFIFERLAKFVMLSIVIFPLILLLPITVPWVIVAVRRRYVIDPHRVLLFRGIL